MKFEYNPLPRSTSHNLWYARVCMQFRLINMHPTSRSVNLLWIHDEHCSQRLSMGRLSRQTPVVSSRQALGIAHLKRQVNT